MSSLMGGDRVTAGAMSRSALQTEMSNLLARNWWAIVLRAIFAIVFGLLAVLLPLAALGSLVLLFAIYMLADGVFAMVASVRAAARHQRWGLLILEGIVNIIAGLVALALPGLTVFVFVTLLGIWSVVTGLLMLGAAFRLHVDHGRWWLGLAGLVSIVWGIMLYLSPAAGALILTWWLGGYAFIFGVMLLILAARLRGRANAI